MAIILASQSSYKQQQLKLLGIEFDSVSPDVNENATKNSSIEALSIELARQKALAVQEQHPKSIIIGSDQTASGPGGQLLQKPNTVENAAKQLTECSGKSIYFYSGVCIMTENSIEQWTVETNVTFRDLSKSEIDRYVAKDRPLDCVGSFKMESLGISLFRQVNSTDPTAIVGLPLISIAEKLRSLDIKIP